MAAPPVLRLTGLRPSEVGLGVSTYAMPASPWWQTSAGVFPAGTIAVVADGAASTAVLTTAPPNHFVVTTHLSLDFFRPATIRSGTLVARGRLIHSTPTQGLAEVSVTDVSGRTLGHGTSRCAIVPSDSHGLATRTDSASDGTGDDLDPHDAPFTGKVLDQTFFNESPGSEWIDGLRRGHWISPVMTFLGLRLVDSTDTTAVLAAPASRSFMTSGGTLYGGITAMLADFTSCFALTGALPPATAYAPIDLQVSYLRPIVPSDGQFIARAEIVHRGRSMAFASCRIEGPDGRLVAIATESLLILPGRPWDRPVSVAHELTDGS